MTRRDMHGAARRTGLVWLGLLLIPLLASCQSSQRHFETPEAAAAALVAAARTHDTAGLVTIFGTEYRELIETEDVTSQQEAQTTFAGEADERLSLEVIGPYTIEIVVGDQEWPVPIPLVKEEKGWRFDTAAGADEIINRRVGRNEIQAMELLAAVVEAQAIYKSSDWDGNGVRDYAMQVKATPGKQDGLFWEADVEAGEEPSPLHYFILDRSDYYTSRADGEPWRGYFVHLIKRQGPNASGGAMDYMDGDRLMNGFALVAWPSNYGSTGIMTFIVSHDGVVYEKDLGDETEKTSEAMDVFDPDESWSVVEVEIMVEVVAD